MVLYADIDILNTDLTDSRKGRQRYMRTTDDPKEHIIKVRLNEDMFKELNKICKTYGLTKTQVVRYCLTKGFKDYKQQKFDFQKI